MDCWDLMSVGKFEALTTTQRLKSFSWSLQKLTNSGTKKFVRIRPANRLGLPVTITPKQDLGGIWTYLGNDLKFSAMCLAANAHLVIEPIGLKFPGRVKENILLRRLRGLRWH